MDKNFYQEYWKIVKTNAREKANKSLGILGRFLALGVTTLSTIILSLLLGASFVNSIIAALIAGSLWLILWISVYIWYKAYEPVDIYNEQKEIIKQQEKIIKPDIHLELSEYRPTPDVEDRWVGVFIKNLAIYSIKQCKVTLETLEGELISSVVTSGKDQLPSELQWSDNNTPDDKGFLVIPREGKVSLDIARSHEKYQRGVILLRRGEHIIGFTSGVYKIEFRIDGEMNGIDIPPQKYSAKIVLDAGVDINIKDIEQITNRR